MWNRFPEKVWPSWLSTSVSHVQCLLSFQLSFSSSVSSRRAIRLTVLHALHAPASSSSHRIYNLLAPNRPRSRSDWLADVDEPAQYAAFPILFTFPSGNQIRHVPKNSSRHLCAHYTLTAVQADTHMHLQAKKEEGVCFFKMLELLFLFLLSSCTLLHPFNTTINLRYWYHDRCTTVVTINKINTKFRVGEGLNFRFEFCKD